MVFDAIRETLRQSTLRDADFVTGLQTYYFELIVPPGQSRSGQRSFLFPMVLNPEQITLEEPFSTESTQTLGGGLYVEEDGIVQRILRIRAHTGFEPKPYRADDWNDIVGPDTGRSFSEKRPRPPATAVGLLAFSGQRHFQFLQDNVFRTYADLKRDPNASLETRLNFHNPKDDEHWRVHPNRLTGDRTTARRTMYPYDLELLVSGPVTDPGEDFSEDKLLIDTIKDAFTMAQSSIRLVRGGVQDLANFVGELESVVAGVGAVLDTALGIADDAEAFVNGATSLIESPLDTVTRTTRSLEAALVTLDAAVTAGARIPDTVLNSLRRTEQGLDRLASFPGLFQSDTQRQLQAIRRSEELSTSATPGELEAAAAQPAPATAQAFEAVGTGNLPGDLNKAAAELALGRGLPAFRSAVEYTVTDGDTLQGIASRQLGDARRWRSIAELNGLQAPYITRDGRPGTKSIGERLLVPSFNPPPQNRTITPVLGAAPDEDPEARLYGTDLELTRLSGPGDRFDFAVDEEGGSSDFRVVSGIDNLKQGLLVRLRTERGTNVLYRNVGHERVVGVAIPGADRDQAVFRIAQALRADPRVVGLTRLDARVEGDRLEVEADVQIVGTTRSQSVAIGF